MMRTTVFCLALLTAPARASMPFAVDADLPQMGARLAYKAYRDAWVLPVDTGAGQFTLALPQICATRGDCGITQTSFEPLTCAELRPVMLDAKWWNENIANDFDPAEPSACPRSFADMADAQALLGSVSSEPFVYMTFPTTVVVRNTAEMLDEHAFRDTVSVNASVPELVLRILFIDKIDLSASTRYSVRQVSATLVLARPEELTLGTIDVTSVCKTLGLTAPPRARLQLVTGGEDGREPSCEWICHLGFFKTPWNLPPSANTSRDGGTCRPIEPAFTLVEFSFAIATEMPAVGAQLLSQDFFAELDKMAAALEAALPIKDAKVALKVAGAITDTTDFGDFAASTAAWMHRQDLMLDVNNASLVVAALQHIGLYERYDNPDHISFDSYSRRRTVHQIPVEGMLVTSDKEATTTFVAAVLRSSITPDLHQFPSYFQVRAVELPDVKTVHVSGPQQTVGAPSAELQRAASNTVLALVLAAVVIVSGCVCYNQYVHRKGWRMAEA